MLFCCGSPVKCEWFNNITQLHQATSEYLSIFNGVSPTVDVCCLGPEQSQYKSRTSVKKHANDVLEIMRFKTQNNNKVYKQLKYYIADKWKEDLFKRWKVVRSLSPKTTLQIQIASDTSDKSWNTIATMSNNALGWRLYCSHNSKFQFRKQIQIISFKIINLVLQRASWNAYDKRSQKEYTVFYMNDLEIMSKGLDKWINNNEWVYMPHFGSEIWWTTGFDKATAVIPELELLNNG